MKELEYKLEVKLVRIEKKESIEILKVQCRLNLTFHDGSCSTIAKNAVFFLAQRRSLIYTIRNLHFCSDSYLASVHRRCGYVPGFAMERLEFNPSMIL